MLDNYNGKSMFFILYKKQINLLKNNKNIAKIISNSSWLLLDKMVRLTLGLIVGAWVARYLGPSEYGILAFSLAFLAFYFPCGTLGMDTIIVRDISRTINERGRILGTAFVLRAVAGVGLWTLSSFVAFFIYGYQSELFIIILICGSVLLIQPFDMIDIYFQSESKSKRTVKVKLAAYTISNFIKIIFILTKQPLIYFAFVFVIEYLVVAFGLVFTYYRYKICDLSFDSRLIKKLLGESWPYIIASISIAIYSRIDQIMIKNILGDKELGIYAALLPLAMLWTFIPMTLNISLSPFLARKRSENYDEFMITLKKIFRLYSFIGWIIGFCVFLLSPIFVPFLFGDSYLSGIPVLVIISFVNIFINLGFAQALWLLNERKSKISLYNTMIGAIVCIISNYFLIPIYGLYGAAVSLLAAQFTSSVLSNYIFAREMFYIQIKSIFLIRTY